MVMCVKCLCVLFKEIIPYNPIHYVRFDAACHTGLLSGGPLNGPSSLHEYHLNRLVQRPPCRQ